MRRYPFAPACLCAAVLLFAWTNGHAAPWPEGARLDPKWGESVRVEAVGRGPQSDWLQVTGRVAYNDDDTQYVTSSFTGRVARVLVKPGDVVKVGQPLLVLVSPEAAQLKAELQKDREDLRQALSSRKRAQALLRDGATSMREAAEADAAYNKAQAEYARDVAHVEALGLDLAKPGTDAVLMARQAGVVTARHVFAGQELRTDNGEPLLTISNLNEVWIWADVYEQDLAQVKPRAKTRARVPAYPGTDFFGEVAHVGDVVDAQARSVKVRCVLANHDRRLKPEMFATVWLEAEHPSRLQVPSQAVLSEGEKTSVVVVRPDGQLVLQPVELGPLRGGHYAVYAGLQGDEKIVTQGALFVVQAARGL